MPGVELESPSLFEMPASRKARALRIATVLTLDLVLAGAGVAMILSYFNARAEAAHPGGAAPASAEDAAPRPSAEVQVAPPRVVRPGETRPRLVETPPASGGSKPGPGTGSGKPPPSGGTGGAGASVGDVLGGIARRPDAGLPRPNPNPTPTPVPAATPDAAPALPPDAAPAPGDTPPPAPSDGEQTLAAGVQRTVEGHMGQVRRCWENAAKSSSDTNLPEGTIEVEFAVLANGSPEGVNIVQNATGSDQLGACVVALVNSWSFPTHDGDPVVFVWPFLFKATK